MKVADRIKNLPPYLFARIDQLKAEQIKKGIDLIDLGVGDPDQPTPPYVVEALERAARDPANHQYPSYTGMNRFREAAARWMEGHYKIRLDPETEVVSLIGSKEGIAHLPLALLNPGEVALITSPGYPPSVSGTLFAGGVPHLLPLRRENRFLPDLKAIPKEIVRRARFLYLNYPNNPTAALAPRSFYEEAVAFARKNEILLVSDAAYAELYDTERPSSLLQVSGAGEVSIEFHSLSKTFNMTGWRIGWACGNAEIVGALGKVKTHIDSGVFQAVQWAGIAALEGPESGREEMRTLYRRRRKLLVEGLQKLGLDVASSSGAFYVWLAVPKGTTSASFSMKLLEEAGIVVTPGVGFGEAGEGYVRLALTRNEARLQEALERMKRLKG